MGFDDYLVKPVTRAERVDTVERLLTDASYDEQLREYSALCSTRAVLVANKSSTELVDSEEFARLEEQIDELDAKLGSTLGSLDVEESAVLCREPGWG